MLYSNQIYPESGNFRNSLTEKHLIILDSCYFRDAAEEEDPTLGADENHVTINISG